MFLIPNNIRNNLSVPDIIRNHFTMFLIWRLVVSVPSTAVEALTSAGASIVADSSPIVMTSRAAPLGRNSEVGRSAILQAKVILAAALRELDSASESIIDCTAAVAIASSWAR